MPNQYLSTLILVSIAACVMAGCPSLNSRYESAIAVVNQQEKPSEEELQKALDDLDYAANDAASNLQYADAEDHDAIAYFIPMAAIAKAKLYARFDQIVNQEEACWWAIRHAEEYLGRHLRQTHAAQKLFANYAVFFRREKIRRHAFTILKETYQRVGEKELAYLMQIQIGCSDAYLCSEFAHKEEQYIRAAENAGWIKKYREKQEDILHAFTLFLLAMERGIEEASIDRKREKLEKQLRSTDDPHRRQYLRERIDELRKEDAESEREYQIAVENEESRHSAQLQQLDATFKHTVRYALVSNFQLLRLSPEIQRLPAFHILQSQVTQLDNYIQREGFNAQAAAKFSEIRNSLDELTVQAQEQARQKRM